MSFLTGMNERQKEAVLATEGPILVLAGAGSGKTRVLTYRIAYLIEEKGVSPYNILALTFTNKAASEMKERISRLIVDGVDDIWTGTFHSICVRILRRNIEKIGYNRSFVIFDTSDQKTLIKDCLKEKDMNEKLFDPNSMLNFIGSQKDKLISPDKYINDNYSDFRERQKGELYELYQNKLKENNALDFDDLINKTIELFRQNPDVLEYYQNKFKYVLVDEYQDTNRAQYMLIKLLAKQHENICVVGDFDQSIYKWRGADIRNILDFEEEYPNAKVIKLEQNYRSTKTILDAANSVIENNLERKDKILWTENEEGDKIKIYNGDNEHDEAYFIVNKIKSICEEDEKSLSDFALLYRTNAQSRVLEEALIKGNIPYKIVGGLKFYDRKEIKDIIAYLRVIQNPVDNISLKRIINVPKRGIGKTTLDKVEDYSIKKGESIYSIMLDAEEIPGLSQRAITNLKSFVSLIGKFIAMKEILGVKDLIENILDSIGYIKELEEENTVEARSRIENLEEFLSVAIDYEANNEESNLEDFLANISLLSDIDRVDTENGEAVTLMTLHSAKGLEFPVVFMTGMEEGLFPSARGFTDDDELEEERRLCYVGITRAKEILYMTYSSIRMLYGKTNYNAVSRFIGEVPESLIDGCNEKKKLNTATQNSSTSSKYFKGYTFENTKKEPNLNSDSENIKAGAKVSHKSWGIGTVVQVKGQGENTEITVTFPSQGIKKLMLAYAPIEVV
ncbi:ATP-dependent DNA helicase PcrA [Gottschalkia purinilytica]|uniref:ATP-dependent DNA helicase n=1 Tax=Gottschalkia purinilytica TaxID=1503 RepID=A0A0L0W6S1_GOTPU|nr:DNA helicase PcrA [Gottschalkia purinilytica]KNF07248.1 ATP-dependent DNA helicase PcrA [Gottschalkia purinilytica]